MIPCSNCKHFDTDWIYDVDDYMDEYEAPICLKNMPLRISDGMKCEKQEQWKQQSKNKWQDYFENWEDF